MSGGHRACARIAQERARLSAHRERFGANADSDLYIGLQLTHSGRFSRPNVWNRPEPLAAHVNPVLDKRFPAGVEADEGRGHRSSDVTISSMPRAVRAYAIGFQFVDIKHCHGYFGHELLSARDRDRPLRRQLSRIGRDSSSAVADGIRAAVPGLGVGVRLSVIDSVPYRKTTDGPGYIGPFYPYPQVPLGWRKVTLEWDDGWWFLDFKDSH